MRTQRFSSTASQLRETSDPEWAPSLPSIWDVEEEEDAHEGLYSSEGGSLDGYASTAEAADPPWPRAGTGPDWLEPDAWVRAEATSGRALADAMGPVVRLDERLRTMSEAARHGARLRLALQAVPNLLWSEGARLRPEYLALADADRIGGGEDAPVLARAAWAVRRMSAGTGLAAQGLAPEGVRGFLGLRETGSVAGQGDAGPSFLETRLVDPAALDEWCASMAALEDLHPLTRAVAGGALWSGLGVTDAAHLLEPALITGSLAAETGQGGALALPVAPPRAGFRIMGGDAERRLAAGLTRLAEGARSGLMLLDRVAAWQSRAADATAGMKGHGPGALIALLAARPIVSARDVATALELTDRHARRLVETLATRGLVRELTGHTRFRFWAARM